MYTAVSFAPVQGFIEKSRKLRDLFGASLILSSLSAKLVEEAETRRLAVISPGLPNIKTGMPNRILICGSISQDEVEKLLRNRWEEMLDICRQWVQEAIPSRTFVWEEQWAHWKRHCWEFFWGQGDSVLAAMRSLEAQKLRRGWIGINWLGESSSLTGTDAIAWHRLGEDTRAPGKPLSSSHKAELEAFYTHLAWILDDPARRARQPLPDSATIQSLIEADELGKFIAPNERISIPELVKRLITLPTIAAKIPIPQLESGFQEIKRDPGCWTGWFMGDGDKVGDKLEQIAQQNGDEGLKNFSEQMRRWGEDLKSNPNLFPEGKGRVIYAGGDDFLGVLYNHQAGKKVEPKQAWQWLQDLPQEWMPLQVQLKKDLSIDYTFSVGFVWAGHQVPQRDILQHCREAEQQSKLKGRDRLTIRVVFNSGQFIEWTCPWDCLSLLRNYQDREGGQNWSHVYSDWQTLKSRHAIRLRSTKSLPVQSDLAMKLLDFYFDEAAKKIQDPRHSIDWRYVVGDNDPLAVVQWIDSFIQVGWQLSCCASKLH
nr:type III-B CRISPR-associated protein Cas10/Cmr2 [Petrachloros mirabilis]